MKYIWVYIVVLVVIIGAIFVYAQGQSKNPPTLDSLSTTEAPWPVELEHLKERLSAIHLPALAAEATAYHIHQHLDLFVHGKVVPIPAGIGIHQNPPSFISALHVHDDSGVIHVESPVKDTFTLGQFFDIWGVRFTPTCIGAYCTDATNTLSVYVNGERYQGDPTKLPLSVHQEIVVTYGTASEVPNPVPTSYSFPSGE